MITKIKKEKGITLIALTVTIIVLLILAGISITMLTGENGILINAKKAKEKTDRKNATEIINLKISSSQTKIYSKEHRVPTLQELADDFCEDNEIEYVNITKKESGEINDKITVGENTRIYTKLEEYPYEFEICSDLKIASINGETTSETHFMGENPEGYIKPSGKKTIVKNGEYDVAEYEKVNVNVPTYEENSTKRITEKSNKIDVSKYQYIDTTELYTASEATGEGTHWASGIVIASEGVNPIKVGFTPSRFVITKDNGATLVYNSSKSTNKTYTCNSKGIFEIEINTINTSISNIRTIGNITTLYLADNSTWYWFATK